MIARTWRGATTTRDASEYEDYMHRVALPGYAEVAGNRLVLMLRRDRDDERSEFTMITLWEDLDAIRSFTGRDPEAAVFYPEDDRYLVERDTVARHQVVYGWHRSVLGWSGRSADGTPAITRWQALCGRRPVGCEEKRPQQHHAPLTTTTACRVRASDSGHEVLHARRF